MVSEERKLVKQNSATSVEETPLMEQKYDHPMLPIQEANVQPELPKSASSADLKPASMVELPIDPRNYSMHSIKEVLKEIDNNGNKERGEKVVTKILNGPGSIDR